MPLKHQIDARKKIIPSGNIEFDEGGVACRSRMCPVRKYNKDKPDKYRVDYFILSDSKDYEMFNLDVYQGKNSTNVSTNELAKVFPTTQKAVLNSIYKLRFDISDGSNGYRHFQWIIVMHILNSL